MIDVTIGILTWNAKRLLDQCLASCYECTSDITFEIVVVDNHSEDGSLDMLAEKYPDVKVIRNEQNRGVAPARNQIYHAAEGRYVTYLDVDTKVLPGALKTLAGIMDDRPDVSLGAPKLLYGDRSLQLSCRPFPDPMTILIEGTFIRNHFLNSRIVKNATMCDWDHNDMREVDCVYGACMMIRKTDMDRIGPFDEGYIYQYEDYDYCFKIMRAGKKVLYIPQAQIIHFYEREQKSVFHPKIHLHIRSILRYLIRDYFPHLCLRHKPADKIHPLDAEKAAVN